jgi:CubicO group peptidase (beta-lactamase class C family)
VGLDEAALGAVVRRIATADPASAAPRIHSLLVARAGRLVLEEYFYGFDASVPHDLRSASKTFTSILAGVAMDRGAPFTMATPAFALLAVDSALLASDPRRSRITVGHLLTHSSGLACDDNDDQSPGQEDRMQRQTAEPDWYRFAMGLAVVADPGSRYAYCSAGINLAGGVVAATLGAWLPALFEEAVARPLDFGRYAINLMPDGQSYSAGGVYLRPRDLLKIGQLYLDGGRWRGRRVVSEAWVRESTAARVAVENGSWDGYGWHRYAIRAGGTTHQEIEASGNGGQYLVLIPSLSLAIASTGGNYGEYGIWKRFRDEIVPAVIAAATAGPTR